MLENIKLLLGIELSDASKDGLLNLYIIRANDAIVTYCRFTDESEIPIALNSLIEDLAILKYQNKGNENLKQEQSGSRFSIFFDDIPPEMKARMNPYRRVKVIG